MPTLIVSPRARPATILAPQPPAVFVDGRRRRDLKVLTWEVLGPPTFGRIVLVLHDGLAPTEPPRMERIGDLPPVGALVSVRPVESAQAMEFQGVVTVSCQVMPAPALSPLDDGYRQELERVARALNDLRKDAIAMHSFDSMGQFAEIMRGYIQASRPYTLSL